VSAREVSQSEVASQIERRRRAVAERWDPELARPSARPAAVLVGAGYPVPTCTSRIRIEHDVLVSDDGTRC
jgi:hypothetical protein